MVGRVSNEAVTAVGLFWRQPFSTRTPLAAPRGTRLRAHHDDLKSNTLNRKRQTPETVAKGTKVIEAAPADLARVEIPVPSLETQQKVVEILDRFDTLTKSLTDGIPAEIEARRAQYGYYRDRLLDFPRKAIGTEWSDGTRAAAKGLPTFVTVANSSRAIWAARRKIAGLNREAPEWRNSNSQ